MTLLTLDSVDYAAKNLVEGCIFIRNNDKENANIKHINGQSVHLCSVLNNPGYNDGQRFTVELRNNAMEQINEINITVYAYDTLFSNIDFCLVGNNNNELSDMIDSAHVVVSYTNNDPDTIKIECIEVKHRLDLSQVLIPIEEFTCDYRSVTSRKYCVHKDVNSDSNSN
jgi:hypothetical protein